MLPLRVSMTGGVGSFRGATDIHENSGRSLFLEASGETEVMVTLTLSIAKGERNPSMYFAKCIDASALRQHDRWCGMFRLKLQTISRR